MRKFYTSILAAIMLVVAMIVPVSAHECDPGRASNSTDAWAYITNGGTSVDRVFADIEIHRPFLESSQYVNQYIELRNGNHYARLGVNYTQGVGTRLFWQGSAISTNYWATSASEVDLYIETVETSSYRQFNFYVGVTRLASYNFYTGRWTPDSVREYVFSSNLGNGIPGHPSDGAFFQAGTFSTTATTGNFNTGSGAIGFPVFRSSGFPATAAVSSSGWFYTRDNC